jgi:CubicO group peptidase (beta-lactamase class C family)
MPLLAVLAAAALALPPRAPLPDSAIRARIADYAERLESLGFDGTILVLRRGRPIVERPIGFANRGARVRATAATAWNLGSITKQFTAALILRLEELGKLRTTDSITRWFPEATGPKRGITLHHLLTHTAGFESDFAPTDYTPNTRAEYMRAILAAPLLAPPGAEYQYANSGYSMLAAIAEMVTGQDYETALYDLVLRPAGMTETGYTRPRWAPARLAHGTEYGRDWGTIVERLAPVGSPFWALRGNGGLQTTMADMARWDAVARTNVVLTDSSRRKWLTGYVNEGPRGRSQYAYGWSVRRTAHGPRVVEHNGGNGIFVAEWRRFVDDSLSLFVASSNAELTASPVADDLEAAILGDAVRPLPRAVPVPAAQLAALAGRWHSAAGDVLDIAAPDGALALRAASERPWRLLQAGDTTAAPRAAELGQRALAIVRAMAQGDGAPLHAALADPEPLDAVMQQVRRLAADRTERLGALKDVVLLGAVDRGPIGLVTTVRLDYERNVVSNVFVWGPGGRIVDRLARPLAPARFVPVAAGAFERVDLRGGPPSPAVRLERVDAARVALVAPNGQRLVFTR